MDAVLLEAVMKFQKYVFLCMYRSEKGWLKCAHQGCSLITVIVPWHGDLLYFSI